MNYSAFQAYILLPCSNELFFILLYGVTDFALLEVRTDEAGNLLPPVKRYRLREKEHKALQISKKI